MCYGLRADFKGDLFPGSEALLVIADKIEEIQDRVLVRPQGYV